MAEAHSQGFHVERVVFQQPTCLCHVLQGELSLRRVAQGQVTVTQCEHRVVHAIAAVGSPIGRLWHAGVNAVQMVARKQRLAHAVHVGLAKLVGPLEVALPDEVDAGVEQVRPELHQLLGVVGTVFRVYPTLLVRSHVERIESFGHTEEASRQFKELGRVLPLLHVQLLVDGLVLHQYRFVPDGIDALVLAISRILEQPRHEPFSLVWPPLAFKYGARLTHFLFLRCRQAWK